MMKDLFSLHFIRFIFFINFQTLFVCHGKKMFRVCCRFRTMKRHEDEYAAFRKEKRTNIDDRQDRSHANLVNTVQPHHCTGSYCLRKKISTQCEVCRFNYPKAHIKQTELSFERHGTNIHGDIYYKVVISTRRNDPILNNFSRVAIDRGRSNMDWQIVLDAVVCMEYITKYTAKAEKTSKECLKVKNTFIFFIPPQIYKILNISFHQILIVVLICQRFLNETTFAVNLPLLL